MLQLLFTINLTEQKSLGESSSSSGKHLQFNQDAINDNRDVDGYKVSLSLFLYILSTVYFNPISLFF